MRVLHLALALVLSTNTAFTASLGITAGVFHFQATDFYYPNYYSEVGYRGTVEWAGFINEDWSLAVKAAAYPMDDNIFEGAAELEMPITRGAGEISFFLSPIAGFKFTKLQYPALYYSYPDHEYIYYVRPGFDIGIGSNGTANAIEGRFLVRADFAVNDNEYDRFYLEYGVEGSYNVGITKRFGLIFRTGISAGGVSHDVLKRTEPYPYVEVGPYFGL